MILAAFALFIIAVSFAIGGWLMLEGASRIWDAVSQERKER